MLKKLGLFLIGGFVGGFLSYIYIKETRLIPLEEEVEDLNAWLIEKESGGNVSEEKSHRLDDEKVLLKDVEDYQKETSRYLYGENKGLVEISEDECGNPPEGAVGWSEFVLQWYAYEQELRDSSDRLVINIGELFGDEDFEPPETWYDASNEVIFLRNFERKCDFRIELNEMRGESEGLESESED